MNIIHVLNTNRFSGAENVVCHIISMLKSDPAFHCYYCSPDGPIRTVLENKRIDYVPLEKMGVTALRKVIREVKPDIIHAHDMKATVVASMACGNIPLISHIHNNAYDSRRLSLKSIAYVLASFKCAHIFWVSDSSYNDYCFKRFVKKKSTLLYNIIDIASLNVHLANEQGNSFIYDAMYLGRLSEEKDPLRFIRVAKIVLDRHPGARMAVVGSGALMEEAKNSAKQLHISNNIDFLGFQENPYPYLRQSKVMVMTSKWEGIPMSALESMALGVPIVSTPTDGLTMLVKDDVCGFLSDNDDVLAEKIDLLISDDGLRQKFSDESSKRAREWNDMEHYRKQLTEIYNSLA